MLRPLLILLAVLIALFLLREGLRRRRARPRPPALTRTVRCAFCGVHLPAEHALLHSDGRHYCSVEHAREDAG